MRRRGAEPGPLSRLVGSREADGCGVYFCVVCCVSSVFGMVSLRCDFFHIFCSLFSSFSQLIFLTLFPFFCRIWSTSFPHLFSFVHHFVNIFSSYLFLSFPYLFLIVSLLFHYLSTIFPLIFYYYFFFHYCSIISPLFFH